MQRTIRICAVIAVIGFLFSVMIYNSTHPAKPDFNAWNEAMTMGNKDTADKHYIVYTDIFCPYCDKFSHAVANHEEEFEEYIAENNIYFEVRMTDMIYESHDAENSRNSAEASYCAAKQGNFWGFYHTLIEKLYEDYHSKEIGSDKGKPSIPDLADSYYYDAAEEGGLDRQAFVDCMNSDETLTEVDTNTRKAQQLTSGGIPYYSFGKFTTSGFSGNFNADHDWRQVKYLLDAGLAQ